MKKMIIEIEGGVVSGVYTSLPEDIEIPVFFLLERSNESD